MNDIIDKKKKRKAKIDGPIKLMFLIRNWIHQGFFYLDKTEMFYRIIWESTPFFISLFLLNYIFPLWCNIIISVFFSHTLNWIINDNFWTCIMFTFPKTLNPGEEKTIKYLIKMQKRLIISKCISGGMIYGSMARNKWQNKSDLDIRYLRKPGIHNGFLAYLFTFRERIIALFNKQPLDVYLADNVNFLRKMRKDEKPIFLKNNDKRLYKEYNISQSTNFNKISSLNKFPIYEST